MTVEVSFSDGTVFNARPLAFMFDSGVVVEAAKPSRATAEQSGQVMTVIGRHFKQSSELGCHFGRSSVASSEFLSSTSVVCSVPVKGHGTVSLGVSNNGVDAGLSSKQLAFEAGRGISSVTPSKASVRGGTTVTVSTYGGMRGEGDTV